MNKGFEATRRQSPSPSRRRRNGSGLRLRYLSTDAYGEQCTNVSMMQKMSAHGAAENCSGVTFLSWRIVACVSARQTGFDYVTCYRSEMKRDAVITDLSSEAKLVSGTLFQDRQLQA